MSQQQTVVHDNFQSLRQGSPLQRGGVPQEPEQRRRRGPDIHQQQAAAERGGRGLAADRRAEVRRDGGADQVAREAAQLDPRPRSVQGEAGERAFRTGGLFGDHEVFGGFRGMERSPRHG